MTQRYRDSLKPHNPVYVPKVGVDHRLDDSVTDRWARAEPDGWIKRGIAGTYDIQRLDWIKKYEEEIDWHVANPDRPTSSSPMNQPLDIEGICKRAGLTDPQREVVLMRLRGDSLPLIAQELGISLGAVQSRWNWGRVKLRVAFGDLGLDIKIE